MTDKTALRARMRRLRARLAVETPDAALRVAERLPADALPLFTAFAGYAAVGAELDPLPLMQALSDRGSCALPVAETRDGPLSFRRWPLGAPLAPDAFGVPAPLPEAAAVAPGLVIVPLLAFDRAGGRLGQGAGVYDRTLEALRRTGPVFVLGLGYAGQELPEIPMEPHDQRLDAILTETAFLRVAKQP